jgi:hypothetical protein
MGSLHCLTPSPSGRVRRNNRASGTREVAHHAETRMMPMRLPLRLIVRAGEPEVRAIEVRGLPVGLGDIGSVVSASPSHRQAIV